MTRKIDAGEIKAGQDRPVEFSTAGALERPEIEIQSVDGPDIGDKIHALAFMSEILEVTIHPSTDKNAEPVVYVANGGRNQYFVRGQTQKVKRMFVEVLARAKETAYTQDVRQDESGNAVQRMIPHTALKYPFQVNHDPNPNGPAWLKQILQEA